MKKVLSFVLILALVLGSFSFAFGLTDIEDSANTEAITVANDLGIITGYEDGSYLPEKAVNRAEFAAMITRALGVPDSALAGFSSTSFKDTSGYGWAVKYLAFCESKGIIIGDGYGNVMPGRTINVNEAMTMVLRAVGYTENSALLVGTWPSKYVTLAQDLGLYDDVASMMTVDRANAAQVIYNALTVQKVQVDADGQTSGLKDKDGNPVNMLTAGLNATAYNDGNAWVVEGTEPTDINLIKYVGAFATAYKNSDGDIIAINEVKSTFITGEFETTTTSGAKFIDGDDNEYTIGQYSYDGTTATAVELFENGVPSTALVVTKEAVYTIAAKVSGKKLQEVYSVNEWEADVTFQWEADMLDKEDAQLNGEDFVQTDNETINFSSFQLLGAKSLEDIDVDDVVYVYEAQLGVAPYATGDITKVTVGTETVNGTVTKVSGTEYTINGTVYEISADSTMSKTVNLGETGTAYLDYDGNIAKWDADDASSENFAVLIATNSAFSFGVTTTSVKLFTKDGTVITPDVHKDAKASADAITLTGIGRIVEYSMDKDGKVDTIKVAADAVANPSGMVNADGTLIGTNRLDAGIIVFLFDGTDYSIGNIADFDTAQNVSDSALTASAVKNATSGKMTAILISDDIISGGDSVYGVINAQSTQTDADGDKYHAIAGFRGTNAAAFDLLTDTKSSAPVPYDVTTSGGVLQVITVNASGIVTAVDAPALGSGGNVDAMHDSSTATVTAVDGNFIKIGTDSYKLAADAVIYLWSATDDKWVVKSAKSILKGKTVKLYESDGGDTDLIYDYVLAVE